MTSETIYRFEPLSRVSQFPSRERLPKHEKPSLTWPGRGSDLFGDAQPPTSGSFPNDYFAGSSPSAYFAFLEAALHMTLIVCTSRVSSIPPGTSAEVMSSEPSSGEDNNPSALAVVAASVLWLCFLCSRISLRHASRSVGSGLGIELDAVESVIAPFGALPVQTWTVWLELPLLDCLSSFD